MRCEFEAAVWRWDAEDRGSWWFLSVPEEFSEHIRTLPRPARGYGSVRVTATIGRTTWSTSLFPDASSGLYLLPVKRAVREAESLSPGLPRHVVLECRI